jgi:ABC-type multidrug transport system fused ATPase/permease subunit
MAASDHISQKKSLSFAPGAEEVNAGNVPAPSTRGLVSFYVSALRQVFRSSQRPLALGFFLVAAVFHAFAHAALALAAGRCAALLAGSLASGRGSAVGLTDGLRVALAFGLAGLAAATVKAGCGALAAYEQARVASDVGARLRVALLEGWFSRYRLRHPRQSDHGPSTHRPPHPSRTETSGLRTGALPTAAGVSALTARVTEVEAGLGQGLLGGARALAQLIPLALALVWLSPRLALAAFVVLIPFGLVLSFTRGAWRSAHTRSARDGEDLLGAADEAVRHADLWVAYSAEDRARATVAQLGERLGKRNAGIAASTAAMSGANEVLAALALVVALGAARAGWLGDVGDGAQMLSFSVCFFLAYRPIRDFTEARLAWSRAAIAYGDVSQLMGPSAPASRAGQPAERRAWSLEDLHVDRLTMEYGTTVPVSFTLPAGEVAVVVGATGEGKTTLVRTLLGLERPRSGDVQFGAVSLGQAPPGLSHRPFAWVPQDSALLCDTLEANVGLGVSADRVDVDGVLRGLGGESLVATTGGRALGPGGVVVSGGERQWIALARALSTDQPVLVLDEPTSGLDPASQAEVLAAIAGLRGTRSVILVTHRKEPLALADVVVRFDGTEVRVEDGPRRAGQARAPRSTET